MKIFSKRSKDRSSTDGTVSESVNQWLAIGMCLGIAVGAATDNIGLWLSLGMCIGAAVGYAIGEKKKKDD